MMREPNKRSRRNPLTSEEVSHIIAHNKKRELIILYKLKKSKAFKVQNVFNVACIFIYLEILFCYFGPCHYQKHFSAKTLVHYGSKTTATGKFVVSDIDLYDVSGTVYKFMIGEFMDDPAQKIQFLIGKDFLLQKELKGVFENSESAYRIFSASPILFLCVFASFISFFGFVMNLNENAYTLGGLTALNILAVFAIITI